MNVLVTDGESRSALALARSLGKYGCSILVTGGETGNIAACSRYCTKAFVVPDPMTDGAGYAEAISRIVRDEKVDAVFPMTEQSVYCLNGIREKLQERTVLACATSEAMQAVSDKFTLFKRAEALGVPVPETVYIDGREDFASQIKRISRFPVVVKPSFSKRGEGGRIISAGVMYASGADELRLLYETRDVLRYPSLIQEQIIGPGTGLFTLFDKDRHLALFAHRRLLEKPPSGGVSVLSESISLDRQMVEDAEKLLTDAEWSGIAMVEFKRDMRDGKAKLMEINGRFWGSLQLAISAGMDFPVLSLEYHMERKPAELLFNYQTGHRLKWIYGILDHIIIRMKGRSVNLPQGVPPLMSVIGELFRYGQRNTSYDVLDTQDLSPFLSETRTYLRTVIGL